MLKLPRIQARLPIVDIKTGNPTNEFQRLLNIETFQAIEQQEAAQDATQAELQAEIDRLNRVLAGTEPFTGVNVDGVIVAENGGLSDDIVTTPSILNQAVTNYASSYTSATVNLTGTTTSTVQTLTYTSTGSRLNVRINFYLTVWHPAAGGIQAIITITRTGVANIFTQTFDAVNGDLLQGWQTIEIEDSPPAGTCTYATEVTLTNNGAATQTAQSRFMGVTELKK